MARLKALIIKEAENGEIKLSDVPAQGATAIIEVSSYIEHASRVEVYAKNQGKLHLLAEQQSFEPVGSKYQVLIPKAKLLDLLGSSKELCYLIYDIHENENESESVFYNIFH
ncbi:hypothetical protein ATI02_1467 [Pseudomonas baetica]|uniref:Uncharacterized protein n=1 Tax=Pseudomonas baetica TaxID=674054 RepID=A0ABX4PUQ0_9PSED|nr:hypothetical protein [Pseudomonas baetica]PKA68680.1 hypothetical protein ATI02_1467 [Pseudomonas baetica]PTC19235.1 hypothetical protein C0J26_12510 [Pseudomonas baetica]